LSEINERITELEIRYSHQSHLLEEFNEILVQFGRRIVELEKENGRLREMLRGLGPEMIESPDE